MPKPAWKLSLDFSSLLGPLFYTWVLQVRTPVLHLDSAGEEEAGLETCVRLLQVDAVIALGAAGLIWTPKVVDS